MMHLSKGLNKLNLDSIAPDLNLPFPNNNHNHTYSKPNKPNKPPIFNNTTSMGGIGSDELDETPPPSVLKNIDYDYLEKHFQIYKYYPSYVHNDEIRTPELKDLIIDKPIYNEANKHVKRKKRKSVKQKQEEKVDKKALQQARELRKEQRQERQELRKEQRDERKELKQKQKLQLQLMKKSYSGHYMNKVNSLNSANGGSNDVGATHGVNPYQMKTQFSNNTTNSNQGHGGTDDYYWNKNQPISRDNSQFNYNYNNHNNFTTNMKKVGSSSTPSSSDDDGPDCAELDPTAMGRMGSIGGGGGYDSERTEVADEFDDDAIAFNNPFDFGKKLSTTGTAIKEEGGIAPVSSTLMSNSSSYNNYTNGPTRTHQNSLFSNPQYSYLYSSRNNSRNNSVVGRGGGGVGPMTGLPDNHPVPAAVPQRRSSSVTLINNSQNSSQNRTNTNNGNSNGGVSYGTHQISQPKRNNSIATKFMSMFRGDSQESSNLSNGNQYEDMDYNDEGDDSDYDFSNTDEFDNNNGATTMMRKASTTKLHKNSHTTNMSRRQSLFGHNNNQTQAQAPEEPTYKPKAGPLATMGYIGGHPMTKSNSFDQTKSQRTKLKNKLKMRFTNELRRFSEQFGMYKNDYNYQGKYYLLLKNNVLLMMMREIHCFLLQRASVLFQA